MMFKLYDVVRLRKSIPGKGLSAGSRGAVVQVYAEGVEPTYLIEFCDTHGVTVTLATVEEEALAPGDE